jgi:putative transposase
VDEREENGSLQLEENRSLRYNLSMLRKEPLVKDEIYHVYNRGVEKRNIFLDEQDHKYFIKNLHDFNTKEPAEHPRLRAKNEENRSLREQLVKIYAFCLMPNHFHMMLEQITDNGITNFMKKIGIGYAMYFNQKYTRSGILFQGRFQTKRIAKDNHFNYLPHYIHLNPVKLIEPDWKQGKINNIQKALDFLNNYKWSSYLDYCGKKNFSQIIEKNFLEQYFETPEKMQNEILELLKTANENKIKDY